jgi:hypothetical protein
VLSFICSLCVFQSSNRVPFFNGSIREQRWRRAPFLRVRGLLCQLP